MNEVAIFWALGHTSLSLSEKSILLHLASLADDTFRIIGESQAGIARLACCTRATVNAAIGRLADMGMLTVENQFDDGVQTPNRYTLNIPPGHRKSLGGLLAARG